MHNTLVLIQTDPRITSTPHFICLFFFSNTKHNCFLWVGLHSLTDVILHTSKYLCYMVAAERRRRQLLNLLRTFTRFSFNVRVVSRCFRSKLWNSYDSAEHVDHFNMFIIRASLRLNVKKTKKNALNLRNTIGRL